MERAGQEMMGEENVFSRVQQFIEVNLDGIILHVTWSLSFSNCRPQWPSNASKETQGNRAGMNDRNCYVSLGKRSEQQNGREKAYGCTSLFYAKKIIPRIQLIVLHTKFTWPILKELLFVYYERANKLRCIINTGAHKYI